MAEQKVEYPVYDPNSGRCKVCGAETLWGDAPHADGCGFARVVVEKDGRIKELESSLSRAHRMLVDDLDALFPLSHEEVAQAKRALLDAVKNYVEDL